MTEFFADPGDAARPVWAVTKGELGDWLGRRSDPTATWADANNFKADAGSILLIPDSEGEITGALLGLGEESDFYTYAALAEKLPGGAWRIERDLDAGAATDVATAFAMGRYAFDRYRKRAAAENKQPRLVAPHGADMDEARLIADGVRLARDLINMPANDMGPEELADAAKQVSAAHDGHIETIVGEALLDRNYPMIHAVGRASSRAPRLIDMVWGAPGAPKVTLVGKGIVFDSGGLDIKPSAGMRLMKKDMGGAANVLGLAQMIMSARLPVRLRVLIPAAENSVSGAAFRPGDILQSRKGTTVEIGNTDAEGRLVLADALTEADSENPALLIDLATLTGAARVALGPEVPPFYSSDDDFAEGLMTASSSVNDPVWRLPLWKPYDKTLDSKIADVCNISDGPFAGSITAALFLNRFVENAATWAHFDIYGWNNKARPGRPIGGEAQAIRALFRLLKRRYSVA